MHTNTNILISQQGPLRRLLCAFSSSSRLTNGDEDKPLLLFFINRRKICIVLFFLPLSLLQLPPTTTTTKFTLHPRAVNENTAQIWLTCLPSCLLFSRKYPTDKDSHPEQEKHQEIKHRCIHTGTQRLIQGRHS